MKKMGIKGKVICVVGPILLGIMIAFFALSRNQIVKLAKGNLSAASQKYTETIDGWTNGILSELTVYENAIDSGLFTSDAQILKYLETSMGLNDAYPNGIYMGDDKGVYLDGSGWVPDSDWVLTERDWYVEGKNHEELKFGAPYFDSLSKQMCVSASVRIKDSKAIRVMAADVYLDYVCDQMKEIENGIGGRAMLVEKSSGKILAHSDETLMDKSLTEDGMDRLYANISKIIKDEHTNAVSVKGKGGQYFACINNIDGTDWCLVTILSQREVLSELHWLEAVMLLVAIAAGVVLTVLLMKVTDGVVKPVKDVTGVLTEVAEGDFTHDIRTKGSDEIARMGQSMQVFIVNMREIIKELNNTSEWLSTQSKENGVASANLLSSADEQEKQMAFLREAADVMTQTADKVSDDMTKLARLIHLTKDEGTKAGVIMKETADASRQGGEALTDIKGSMQQIEQTTFSLAERIKDTSDAIDKINGMVTMIMEIANQTNLLSLNAAIEAARAGDAGRGFAVVAEEIGKLAVNSGQAASDISKLTAEIKDTMGKANAHMQESVSGVKMSADMIESASGTFSNIFDKVGQTDTIVRDMVDLIGKVDIVASETVKMADSQTAAAGEITASAERLGDCTESVNNNSRKVAENARALEQQAEALAERMNGFTV